MLLTISEEVAFALVWVPRYNGCRGRI